MSEATRKGWTIESPTALLVILALMNFVNYADRQLIAPLAPLLELPAAEGGLGLSRTQIGLLFTAFMLVHSVASIPLGVLADRYMRKRLIAVGVGLWSLATAFAGFATTFRGIFLARAAVGIGEATYAPAASALISERFSPRTRARALGVFQIGMVLGGAVGLAVGGTVAAAWGWRAAFFVFGFPGLILTGLILLVYEPPPRVKPAQREKGAAFLKRQLWTIFHSPGLIRIYLAGILITFFVGALIVWGTQFILDTHYDSDPHQLGRVSRLFGGLAGVASIGGALFGSYLADRIEAARPGQGRLLAVALSAFLTVPCTILGLLASSPLGLFTWLTLGVFFATWYVGPILAAVHEVVPADARGIATGLYFFLVHMLGDAISPVFVGKVADSTGSLRTGLLATVVALVLGGLAALSALPSQKRRVATSDPHE